MEVLVLGNLSGLSNRFYKRFSKEGRIVLYPNAKCFACRDKNIIEYEQQEKTADLERLFETFQFQAVFFVSQIIDGRLKMADEVEQIEQVLHLCKEYQVKHFCYITSNDTNGTLSEEELKDGRSILIRTCMKLCEFATTQSDLLVRILKIPYLYSCEKADNTFFHWVEESKQGTIKVRGAKNSKTDFLCDEDLAELLLRIIDEAAEEPLQIMDLCGGNGMQFDKIEQLFGVNIDYENHIRGIPILKVSDLARRLYGWFPTHQIQDDLKVIKEHLEKDYEKQKSQNKEVNKWRERIRIVLEIILLWLLASFANSYFKNNIFVSFIDFNLIFVLIIGMMDGLQAGMLAAVLASTSYVLRFVGPDWRLLFYNVQNWLPFACYFLLGTSIGYKKEKAADIERSLKEEAKIMEKKYAFLHTLYINVLENKKEFNNQIIGYQNSFGRIYHVVKQLDTVLPDKVFLEAVNVLEDILQNQFVAIYTTNHESDYIRLNICSKALGTELHKSLKLSDFPKMANKLKNNEMFVNTEGEAGYPVYASPIVKENKMLGVIILQYVDDEQMNMEYYNKFHIIAGLVHTSLIRAMEYDALMQKQNMVEDSKIMKTEKFEEILQIRREMKKKEYLEYVLLKLQGKEKAITEIGNEVSQLVRANDVLGQGKDGELYLLLAQTKDTELSIIRERLDKHHITFEIINME